MKLRVGIDLASLRLPFKKALHTAARLGADAVEIDARSQLKPREFTGTALRHLRKMLDDLNLRVCAVSFRTRRGYMVMPKTSTAASKPPKTRIRMAYDLGASSVVNQVGRVPEEPSGPDWDLLIQVLTDLGKLQPTHGRGTGCGNGQRRRQFAQPGKIASPIFARGSHLGVCLNPGNLIVNGFSAH